MAADRRLLCRPTADFTLVLLDHDLGGLDDGRNFVALLQLHLLRTVFGDDRLHQTVADFDGDESCDRSEQDFGDLTLQMVASAKRHKSFLPDDYRGRLRTSEALHPVALES